jgi:hypothetical protein
VSYWNYRIVKKPNGNYAVHEVYYKGDDKIYGMTEEPATGEWESVNQLQGDLFYMLRACGLEILVEDEIEFVELEEPDEAYFKTDSQ